MSTIVDSFSQMSCSPRRLCSASHYPHRGYRVLAPAYPGFQVEVAALNADPSPIEALTVPTHAA